MPRCAVCSISHPQRAQQTLLVAAWQPSSRPERCSGGRILLLSSTVCQRAGRPSGSLDAFSLVVSLAPLALSFARPFAPPCHAHGRHRTERGCAQPYHRITLSPYHRVAALRCSVTTSTSEYYSTHHSDSMARYSARTYSILAGRPVRDWLAQHERDMDVDVDAYTEDGVGVEMARGLQPNENRRTGEQENGRTGSQRLGSAHKVRNASHIAQLEPSTSRGPCLKLKLVIVAEPRARPANRQPSAIHTDVLA